MMPILYDVVVLLEIRCRSRFLTLIDNLHIKHLLFMLPVNTSLVIQLTLCFVQTFKNHIHVLFSRRGTLT